MKWSDSLLIAEALDDKYPEIDPLRVRFTDLHQWVLALHDFDDSANNSNEKILESIQCAWIDERS